MYCTNCGVELRDSDRFCSQCGKPSKPEAHRSDRPLRLAVEGKKIGGVCAGFARYFEVDVTLIRVCWLTAALATGVGFLAYLVAWLIIPKEESSLASPPSEVVHPSAG